ncbi:plasmid pRiA4b ORF-3 family protein [Lewinella sp. IMCC34191]|uniref:plasmid pRiA4b ORF-3 family protein n=1 Tax=Lewinella sp. IMCC34191 TaxID=2259172 RepID=UPI000E26DD2B|nr:plasmid pRiA4b ORF-3 family protein [Lewinella sp. IMCC34191]
MKKVPTDNLQQAIANAAKEVRQRHPDLTQQDVGDAYARYRTHFREREDDPPVSNREAEDELLLAIWDVIVDRETEGLDEPDGLLEDYYAQTFDALLRAEADTDEVEPIAVAGTEIVAEADPPPVMAEEEDTTTNAIEDEETDPVNTIYRLQVVLDGSRPAVKRVLLVDKHVNQSQLHFIIQAAMGWRGTEQFQFYPSREQELPSSGEILLGDLFDKEGDHCGYEFDTWYHDIELLDRERPEGRRHYPVCIAGERACPPEDIGGVAAYNEMVEVLNQPDHPDYTEMAGWLTQDFHPDAFNMDQANLRLSQYRDSEFKAVV